MLGLLVGYAGWTTDKPAPRPQQTTSARAAGGIRACMPARVRDRVDRLVARPARRRARRARLAARLVVIFRDYLPGGDGYRQACFERGARGYGD